MRTEERETIVSILKGMLKLREGNTAVTPCGNCRTVEEGVTMDELDGKMHCMLWYNVGKDTKAVKVELEIS
jgi:hypothetical protein